MRNILRKDVAGELNENNVWKHCFNMGGGLAARVTGYDTFAMGFGTFGAKVEQFFDTNYNSMRNFHGEWYSDAYKLNDLFDYQHESVEDFWNHILKKNPYFKGFGGFCQQKDYLRSSKYTFPQNCAWGFSIKELPLISHSQS